MKIIKAILIASLSVPALVFATFLLAGISFLVLELFEKGEYSNGWLGIVYAGSMYAYFAIPLSTVPTIVLGTPISLIAKKYGLLTKKVILVGAAITGGIFLVIAAIAFFDTINMELIGWTFIAGGIGGLINGYVFQKAKKPNNRLQYDAATPRA
jgi:hypothetical protein